MGAAGAPEFGAFAFKALPLGGPDGLWLSAHLDDKAPLFDRVWSIYQEAFVDFERRTLAEHRGAMARPGYRFSAVMREGEAVGLLGWWSLDGFLFVEHFAINPSLRSGGLGRRALAALQAHAPVPVVVDVEPFGSDPMAARRVAFYQRLGFHYCGVPVTLPPYLGKAAAPSNFMAWPYALDAAERERCLSAIRSGVYGA